MTYYIHDSYMGTVIVRVNEDGSATWIPADSSNADFRAYEEWLAEGNTPEPWPPAE